MSKYSASKYALMAGLPKASSPTTLSAPPMKTLQLKTPTITPKPTAQQPFSTLVVPSEVPAPFAAASTSYTSNYTAKQTVNRSWDVMAAVTVGGCLVKLKTYEDESEAKKGLEEAQKSGMFKVLKLVPGKMLNKTTEADVLPPLAATPFMTNLKPAQSVLYKRIAAVSSMREKPNRAASVGGSRPKEKALPQVLSPNVLPGQESAMTKIERWQAGLI